MNIIERVIPDETNALLLGEDMTTNKDLDVIIKQIYVCLIQQIYR